MKRLEATVQGRVQGVNFRYYTQQVANELHLTGWVKNQRDGSVYVVAEGSDDRLSQLVDFLHHGQPPARVDKVNSTLTEGAGEFARFSIRWS
ncbi:MAG: acylphosphatase [Chloroflexi bacterium]|nr:acylphosphatase [Chloroflexota bacterium]